MDLITAYAIYMTVAILVVGLWAARVPHEDVGTVFVLALAWPATIVFIVVIMLMNATGWDINITKGAKMFGFRRPTNPNARGFAVTAFNAEIQVYSIRPTKTVD
jgi:hypothetical protein